MQRKTFEAAYELIRHRWPWPDGAAEIEREYRDTLWAEVESWRAEWSAAFKRAVMDLLEEFERPPIRKVVARSLAIANAKPGPRKERAGLPEDLADRERMLVGMFRTQRWPKDPPSDETRKRAAEWVKRLLASCAQRKERLLSVLDRRKSEPVRLFGDDGAPAGEEIPF